jgi:hypothetical protein
MLKNISNTNIQEQHQHQCAKKCQQHQCVQITPTRLNNTSVFKQTNVFKNNNTNTPKEQQHWLFKTSTTLAFQNINNTNSKKQ